MGRQLAGSGIYLSLEDFRLHSRKTNVVDDVIRNKSSPLRFPFLDCLSHCGSIAEYVVQTLIVGNGELVWEQRVILQVFTYLGTANDNWNPQWIEVGWITDPRKLEDLHGTDTAGR